MNSEFRELLESRPLISEHRNKSLFLMLTELSYERVFICLKFLHYK